MLRTLATFIVRHSRLVLVITGIALVGMGIVGVGAFGKLEDEGTEDPSDESTAAQELMDEHFSDDVDLVFLVESSAGDVDDADTTAAGTQLSEEMAADDDLEQVVSYWTTGAESLRSDDGSSALVVASIAGDVEDITDNYDGQRGPLDVTVGGPEIVGEEMPAQVGEDLAVAESIAVPLILILLVFAFGSLVAATLPLIVGIIAIFGAFSVLSILGSFTDVSVYSINLTTALGLALGIDYALLMVSRYREELTRGASVSDAVVRTVDSAGRTIVFSGLAIVAALAALLLFPLYFLRSFAYGGIGVVAVAVAGAVLVLPALLAALGTKVNSGRLPWARTVTRGSEAPFWGRLAATVMRRPAILGGVVVAILLVVAAPLLRVDFATPDDRVLPDSAASRQVGDALRDDYAGDDTAAFDVVTTDAVSDTDLEAYAGELSQLDSVDRVESAAGTFADGERVSDPVADDGFTTDDASRLAVVSPADALSDTARALVGEIRDVPQPAGTQFVVGGDAAVLVDSLESIGDVLPFAVLWIVLTTLIVLFLFTGSLVQPIRALITNGLTIMATFGLMVLVFQDGNGSSLLGFTPLPLDMAMMVLLFVIAFGLSMDYEVFVMSRIKERHDAGESVADATVGGLTHSGRIVTTAAALIAVSFFAFLTSQVTFLQLFGLGAGVAILIDATLVRGVLVPASMRLMGRRSWYAPAPLRRLHERFGLSDT